MDLFCIEINGELKAYSDPVFLDDERVLKNLMCTEERYTISSSYFKCLQTELKPYMRKVVASWMLEVSNRCSNTPQYKIHFIIVSNNNNLILLVVSIFSSIFSIINFSQTFQYVSNYTNIRNSLSNLIKFFQFISLSYLNYSLKALNRFGFKSFYS
jgi:hypothetical protein